MAIQTLHDTGTDYQIPSKYDGGVYAVATPDCVCQGVGDEFTINYHSRQCCLIQKLCNFKYKCTLQWREKGTDMR